MSDLTQPNADQRDAERYLPAALRTIVASRWTLLCARLFGRKVVARDGTTQVTLARWGGRFYLIDWQEDPDSG